MAVLRWLWSCCRPCREFFKLTLLLTCVVPMILLSSSGKFINIFGGTQEEAPVLIKQRYLDHVKYNSNDPFRRGLDIAKKANIKHSHHISHDKNFDRLYAKDVQKHPSFFNRLTASRDVQCGGKFQGFLSLTAVLHDVVIDRDKCNGPKGGEKFEELMNQSEDVEYLKYQPGFFVMNCDKRISYTFKESNTHLHRWMEVLRQGAVDDVDEVIDDFTIAITRYEYVNMYHTMTDYYNAFLVMAYFNQTQHQTNILLLDAHPAGGLDSVWGTVFNSMTRVSQLPRKTRFTNLVFNILSYHSPLYVSQKVSTKLPLSEEFREFFLSSYDIPTFYPLDCDKLSILLIWRRNYVAHPRNPSGTVHRKIYNEKELETTIQKSYPGAKVRGVQTDRFEVSDQVKLFAECDILIGMHGAALTEMLFMHEGRGIIELYPKYVQPTWRGHFIKMAAEKNLIYESWINTDSSLEHADYHTEVPPQVVLKKIELVKKRMCT